MRRYQKIFGFIQLLDSDSDHATSMTSMAPWRAKEAEYAAARARIFGYSANGGPLDQADTSEQVTGKKWKKNTKRKEHENCNRLQEPDEAVAGRVKVEAWPQMVDVAFADQLKYDEMIEMYEMYDEMVDFPQIHGPCQGKHDILMVY